MPLYGTKPCDPAYVQCRMNLDNNRAQIKRQRDSETRAAWSAPSSATWTSNRVSDKPSLKRTAWHEAGHAVVAWEQGLTVTHVSIRPEGERVLNGQRIRRPATAPSSRNATERILWPWVDGPTNWLRAKWVTIIGRMIAATVRYF